MSAGTQARAAMPAPPTGELTLPCCDCGEWKPKRAFNRTGNGHPKRYCRDCDNARRRERYRKNDEMRLKALAYQREYRPLKRDYINERQKRYYEANRDRVLAINQRYRDAHRDEINARRRAKYRAAKSAQADSNG